MVSKEKNLPLKVLRLLSRARKKIRGFSLLASILREEWAFRLRFFVNPKILDLSRFYITKHSKKKIAKKKNTQFIKLQMIIYK